MLSKYDLYTLYRVIADPSRTTHLEDGVGQDDDATHTVGTEYL